ncbi:hypothetical protein HDU79_005875 [Rhizoclosmatium sp. JEL0117]|nr:hypothetical protein HDU79_005875 [Rhizoclosmatium sp. JEL0117]
MLIRLCGGQAFRRRQFPRSTLFSTRTTSTSTSTLTARATKEEEDDEWVIRDGVFVRSTSSAAPSSTGSTGSTGSSNSSSSSAPSSTLSGSTASVIVPASAPSQPPPSESASPAATLPDPPPVQQQQQQNPDTTNAVRADRWAQLMRTLSKDQTTSSQTNYNHHHHHQHPRHPSNYNHSSPLVKPGVLSPSSTQNQPPSRTSETESITFPTSSLLQSHLSLNHVPNSHWSTTLDRFYHSWSSNEQTSAENQSDNSISAFFKNTPNPSINQLITFAAPYLCPKQPTSPSTPSSQSKSNATHSHVSQSPLHGIKPALVYQLYSTVSSKSPSLLNALTQSHWDSLAQHTLLAFLPTDPSTCPTIPQFLPPMLTSCSTRIITDMKLRNVPFTATTFAALYKSHIGDPRKAIAIHEIARAQMDAKSCLVPVISDESIQTLIGVLLYGGNAIRSPEVHIQRSGPILAYRTTSSGTKPTLVDIASVMEDLWQDLETYEIRASRATLLAFVEAFGSFKEKNWVEQVHRRMTLGGGKTKRGAEFTIDVYRALMVAHEQCENYGAVVRLFDALEASDETIQLLLDSLVKIAPPSRITTPYLTSVNEFISQALDLSSQSHRPITIASYVSLITSACKLSSLPLAYTSYNDMKAAILLRNAHTTALETFTSRTAVASILETESANPTTSSFETAVSFFRAEVLTLSRVSHHWRRISAGFQTAQTAKLTNLQRDLSSQFSQTSKKAQRLVSDISALESKIAAGVPVRVGLNGPFAVCYKALDAGFRKGLELRISEQGIEEGIGSGIDRGSELMMLANKLEELEAEERELVRMACEMDDGGVMKVSFDIDIK